MLRPEADTFRGLGCTFARTSKSVKRDAYGGEVRIDWLKIRVIKVSPKSMSYSGVCHATSKYLLELQAKAILYGTKNRAILISVFGILSYDSTG
jgi:hypothetical protein